MNRLLLLAMLAYSSLAATTLCAHGPQIQVTADGGKIITRDVLVNHYTPLTSPKSAYVMPVHEVARTTGSFFGVVPETAPNAILPGQYQYDFGPGLAYGVGQTFAAGSTLSLAFTQGLLTWDGTQFVDAGQTQLQMNYAGSVVATNDSGPSAPLPIVADVGAGHGGYGDASHASVTYQFLGDGATFSEPADGIYLASLVLSSSEPGLAASDPFQFVLHKNTPLTDVFAAVNSLAIPSGQVQVIGVPEPTSVALSLLGAGLLSFRFRRRQSLSRRGGRRK